MIWALIVAGGSGSRMNSAQKKQFLHLDGVPILARTLMAFDRSPDIDRLVVVVPASVREQCQRQIVAPADLRHPVELVEGGARRQDSVRNGLVALAADDGTVLIHDGVRPFVRRSLIRVCLEGVAKTGACIPVVAPTDTLKQVGKDGIIDHTVDRQQIRLAQTPQTFSLDLIRRAHLQAAEKGVVATDDASLAEWAGAQVKVVAGDHHNIKITHPTDMPLAEAIWAHWQHPADS